ncbi:hypothetical protein HGRIS_005674 [Hohenbuehelia grisea]|uniref:Transcription factor domain-containing protein n=1 Tax=Hohenbuehelia grisea TaxID=104357 RepID=A0ABR3JXR6_9AGAR
MADQPSSSFNQPGLALPNQSFQNQIHELAKTLPPPRKQNTACDACSDSAFGGVPPRSTRMAYGDWGDQAYKLENEAFRAEFALDLVEVFFQIVHTRLPLLNPANFRLSLGLHPATPASPSSSSPLASITNPLSPSSSSVHIPSAPPAGMPSDPDVGKSLHPALVATVLAWGTKFSEHPLLVADRELHGGSPKHSHGSGSGLGKKTSGYGQSRMAKALIDRAREIAEALKVHRVPTPDHVVIGLLLEPLQSQNPDDPQGFHGFWLTAATRHLLDLGINHKSVMSNIQDPEARGTMIFAWWMTCLSDAYGAAYYRRKPVLDDDDYDIDFYTAVDSSAGGSSPSSGTGDDPPNPQGPTPSPREQLEFLGYYRAAHSLARIARNMSRQLWRPATEADGVSLDVLTSCITALVEWRESYLSMVGVPSNFEGEWDFVSAVSSCASDATYHVMWIILFSALDDFGIREVNEVVRIGSVPSQHLANYSQIESAKRKVMEEALHGALRIAGLAGVLTSNGYLRLDPAVMHVSCINAGTLLARLGRPEVSNCIAGLEQYSYSYEEAGEQAAEISQLYKSTLSGETNLHHMSAVTARPAVSAGNNSSGGSPTVAGDSRDAGMAVDEDTAMGGPERSNGFYQQRQTFSHPAHAVFGQ